MLTDKEFQILMLRKEGLLQKEIADRLKITQGAVSRFEANARDKIRDALTDLQLLERLSISTKTEIYGLDEKRKRLERMLGRWDK